MKNQTANSGVTFEQQKLTVTEQKQIKGGGISTGTIGVTNVQKP